VKASGGSPAYRANQDVASRRSELQHLMVVGASVLSTLSPSLGRVDRVNAGHSLPR
jgi:hypothetical protein